MTLGVQVWRNCVAVADLPQAYGNDVGLEIYDELLGEFGDNAANTIVSRVSATHALLSAMPMLTWTLGVHLHFPPW